MVKRKLYQRKIEKRDME